MYIYPLFNNLRLMYHFGPLSPAMGGDKSPPCGNLYGQPCLYIPVGLWVTS